MTTPTPTPTAHRDWSVVSTWVAVLTGVAAIVTGFVPHLDIAAYVLAAATAAAGTVRVVDVVVHGKGSLLSRFVVSLESLAQVVPSVLHALPATAERAPSKASAKK